MIELLRCFIDICLLRRAPQDLPASSFLLGLSLLLHVAVDLAMSLFGLPVVRALGLSIVDAGLLAGLLWVLLWIRERLPRYTQTLTALFGVGAVMQLVAAPAVLWQWSAEPGGTATLIATLLLWIWLLWNLVVIGHVLRHALSTTLPIGIALALVYVFVNFGITKNLFFPEATL